MALAVGAEKRFDRKPDRQVQHHADHCRRDGREGAAERAIRPQPLDVHRLDQVSVHAGVNAALLLAFHGVGGHRDNRRACCFAAFGLGGADSGFGAFRVPGLKAFHAYLNDRFYDQTLYAPKDVVPYNNISKYFTNAAEFTYNPSDGLYEDSSYCFSPAAMYDSKVFGRNSSTLNGNGYTNPATLPAGYRSPGVARCKYPSLKTRMIEHNWLQNTPDQFVNSAFAGNSTPWFFNHGYNSAPASLFFDGHIELVGCQRAMQAEQRAGKLWSRNTPLGANGYWGNQSYDFLVKTSFSILTTDGIEGRDVLGAEG